MTAGDKLLADILAEPDDDGLRLIYADWLQEQGEAAAGELAEVRQEIKGLRKDGHGHGTNRPHGGDCPICFRLAQLEYHKLKELKDLAVPYFRAQFIRAAIARGDDHAQAEFGELKGLFPPFEEFRAFGLPSFGNVTCYRPLYEQRIAQVEDPTRALRSEALLCLTWHGFLGEVAAGLARLVHDLRPLARAHPLRHVRTTDRAPEQYPRGGYLWVCWREGEEAESDQPPVLPAWLFDLLAAGVPWWDDAVMAWRAAYPTEQAARADLSRALLMWATAQECPHCGGGRNLRWAWARLDDAGRPYCTTCRGAGYLIASPGPTSR